MTSTRSSSTQTKTRSATRRLESFRQRFGDGHVYLACHAALPLALTPDLLYSLWANFQRDTHGEAIEIPWIAVADLMLSNLCKEVGNELYEMDQAVRDELLNQLQNDSRLGQERLRELADFVMAYVEQQLDSPDLDVRDLATGQKWRALAYKQPSEAAHSIATVLAQLPLNDKAEWIRMAALLNSLAEPLAAFQPLLNYIRAMADLARGNLAAATAQMTQAVDANREVRVEGVNLPIPDVLNGTLPKSNEPNVLPTSPPNRLRMPIAIAGATIVSVLILTGVQYGLRSPDPQITPEVTSSATPTPSPQSSPSTSPRVQQSPSTSPLLPNSNSSPSITSLPSTLQGTPITSTSSSKSGSNTTVPGSTSVVGTSSTLQQKTPSPSPLPTSSPSPKPPPVNKEVQTLQESLKKIQVSRPGEPLSVSPDNKLIVSGGEDGELRLWNSNGILLQTMIGHSGRVTDVSFSPDGQLIASSSYDKTIRLWDKGGKLVMTLLGHQGAVNSVSFSPDGKILATASEDGTVKLWDTAGKQIATLKGHQGAVNSVSFSPDGKTIITMGNDNTIRNWSQDGRLLESTRK